MGGVGGEQEESYWGETHCTSSSAAKNGMIDSLMSPSSRFHPLNGQGKHVSERECWQRVGKAVREVEGCFLRCTCASYSLG